MVIADWMQCIVSIECETFMMQYQVQVLESIY